MFCLFLLACCTLSLHANQLASGPQAQEIRTTVTAKPKIQVALLLDTSNSMDGLIDQAKSQLWKMVNELATAKQNGQSPDIELALYEYGNDGLQAKEGYLRQITGLTSDLDLVSEKLFELKTNGGTEMCGWVIDNATQSLKWSPNNDDLKIIFIAGNESFAQGPKTFTESCKSAITKGIIINTIHCGNYQKGIQDQWQEGAELADGQYMHIDQSQKVIHISTPYDQEINSLNQKLNETYIGYGTAGQAKAERQMAQDANAASYGSANARTRAAFKSKASYNNSEWDLVDAAAEDEEVLAEMEPEELPEPMQEMDTAERKAFVEAKAKERAEIQAKIKTLNTKAEAYIVEKRKNTSETQTLDKVMLETVRQQANQKQYQFDK